MFMKEKNDSFAVSSWNLAMKNRFLIFGFFVCCGAQTTFSAIGDGWVVRVRNSGDESQLGIKGFAVEASLDREHRIFKVRGKTRQAVQNFVALGMGRQENDANTVAALLRQIPDVEWAEQNSIYRASSGARRPQNIRDELDAEKPDLNFLEVIPNDPYFQSLWGLRNRGQTIDFGVRGVEGADTRASGAWVFEKGSEQVVVGVLDTGIDLQHEDLKDNLWTDSSGSQPIHGYNVFNSSQAPQDDNGHGTHVAGTIGAVGDNGIGVTGVNWKVSLMAVKILNGDGEGDIAGIVAGIDWAVAHGARVINASWGGGGASRIMQDSISRAADEGVLFVAAAGNDGEDNDRVSSFPANYALPNIISVAASDNQDKLADFSNYGIKKVHIAAPGVSIYSTLPGNHYGSESGTSMATPHVAGAAALLLSRSPNLSVSEIRAKIFGSADRIPAFSSKIANGGARLNLMRLVKQ
jgi:subtilisin family serine protease